MLLATSMQAGVARQLGQRPAQAIVVTQTPVRTLTGAKPLWGQARRFRLQHNLPVRAAAQRKDAGTVGKLQQLDIKAQEDPTPFFEPLLRSFLLGLGAGALFESAHVALKFVGLMGEVSVRELSDVLPLVSERFSPLFLGDHVVALTCWVLFYIIEAVAIYSVINKYPNDAEAARRAVGKLVTLPKKMLPMRLQLFKQLLLKGSNSLRPASASACLGVLDRPTTILDRNTTIQTMPRGTSTIVKPPQQSPPRMPRMVPPPMKEQEAETPPRNQPAKDDEAPRSSVVRAPQGLAEQRLKRGLRPGQLDPEVGGELAHRMRELTGRRSYLRNFWYAAGISEKVGAKPVGVEILGEKVVLYRDSAGSIHCLGDVCPHRGAPLHQGWVSEVNGHDCVVCPYHGWAFDSEGVLRDVPAAEHSGEWPQKALIEAYPVQEKGGFIWLFYGSKSLPVEERPPIPCVPELEDPSWKPVYGEIEFECNHWSVFENAIDMAHIHYLHNDTFGNQGQPQIRGMTCSTDAYGVHADFRLHNKPVNAMWEFSKVPEVVVTAQALLPSTSVIGFTLGNGLSFTTFVNTVPINEHRTINRFALVRKLSVDKLGPTPEGLLGRAFNLNAWDSVARNAMIRILSEDKAMVEQLRPDMLVREISVKADLPQMAFRKLRQEYIDMGYGVLPESTTQRFRSDQ